MDVEPPSISYDEIKEYIKTELLDLREDEAEDRILKICDENHIKNDQKRILKKYYKAEKREYNINKNEEIKEPSAFRVLYSDRITEMSKLEIISQIKEIVLSDWLQVREDDALLFIKGISEDYGLDVESKNILKKFYKIEKAEWNSKNKEGKVQEEPTYQEEFVNNTVRDWNQYITPAADNGNYFLTLSGIFRTTEKYNETTLETISTTHDVCRTPFVLCGKSTPIKDDAIYYKVRYLSHDDSIVEFWASQTELLSKKELKTIFLARGINCPENELLAETVEYNSRSIGEFGTRFKSEFSSKQNGWNADKTIFVIGNRAITANGVEPVLTVGNVKGFPELEKKGTLDDWVAGVNSMMEYDVVRFKFYDAFTAPLNAILGIESHITDNYGNTSVGKTFSAWMGLSGIGDAEGLTIGARSSAKGILVTIRDFSDLPILIDESSDAGDHLADLVYPLTSNKGRVKSTQDGKRDGGEEYHTTTMFTGERPIRDCLQNSGQQYRVTELDDVLPDLPTIEIKRVTTAIRENHGHIIELFMQEVFKRLGNKTLRSLYDNCFDVLPKNTSNIEGRSRAIFAGIMTAGKILECIFEEIGIQKKSAVDIVSEFFKKCIQEKPVELEYMRALRIVLDWIHSDYGKFSDSVMVDIPSKSNGEGLDRFNEESKKIEVITNHDKNKRYGYVDGQYIDIIGTEFTKKMKEERFSPSKIKEDWYKQGISDSDSKSDRIGTFRFVRDDKKIAGVRIFRTIAEEKVGVNIPAKDDLSMDSKIRLVYDTISFLQEKKGSAKLNLIRLITEIPELNELLRILCEYSKIMKIDQDSYKVII